MKLNPVLMAASFINEAVSVLRHDFVEDDREIFANEILGQRDGGKKNRSLKHG
ncbi:MAG: hypothetical protein HY717_02235 [Planctomycetes bacterium]|nr:hypothetical protein [Planctomycetota bacterium]